MSNDLPLQKKLKSSRAMWTHKRNVLIQSLANAVGSIKNLDPGNKMGTYDMKNTLDSALMATLDMQGEAELIRQLEAPNADI